MAYKVLTINKEGNKIIDYTCDYNGQEVRLDKHRLVKEIQNKCVENARIQNYKGQIIIRVDLDGVDKKGRKPGQKTKSKEHEKNNNTSCHDLLMQMFNEYRLNCFDKYKDIYFRAHTEQLEKNIKTTDYREKLNILIEMQNFCEIVRDREYNITKERLAKSFDSLEYKAYCQENNINEEGGIIKGNRKIAGHSLSDAFDQIMDVNKEESSICNGITNKADNTEPKKTTNNQETKVYNHIDVLNILKNLEEGTPLKINFTSEENYKQALFMGCKEESFGMLEYYFYDGSIFKFSERFISNNKSVAVILNNNDTIRVAQLIKMLNQ